MNELSKSSAVKFYVKARQELLIKVIEGRMQIPSRLAHQLLGSGGLFCPTDIGECKTIG